MKPRFLSNLFWLNVVMTVLLGWRQPLAAQNPISQSPVQSLKVVAEVQQRVHQYQPINLNVQVINITKTAQSFQAWSCSWHDEWQTSDPRIFLPGNYACAANARITITLLPGQAYYKR